MLQAVIILSLYSYPVMQVILSVELNFIDLAMNMMYRPYSSKREQLTETANGIALMLILYCLMLFAGQSMADKK